MIENMELAIGHMQSFVDSNEHLKEVFEAQKSLLADTLDAKTAEVKFMTHSSVSATKICLSLLHLGPHSSWPNILLFMVFMLYAVKVWPTNRKFTRAPTPHPRYFSCFLRMFACF